MFASNLNFMEIILKLRLADLTQVEHPMLLTKAKEDEVQATLNSKVNQPSSDPEQILHLKRLLVTLKQQYEKGLQQLNEQLLKEQARTQSLLKKLELSEEQRFNSKKLQDEELNALRQQIVALRDSSKKVEAEETILSPELEMSRQRIEQLERVIPYLRERTNEANLETEQLRDELNELRQINEDLKKKFEETQFNEEEKSVQQGRALEAANGEILGEKIALEHQLEHSQKQIHSLQTQMEELAQQNRILEMEKHDLNAELEEVLKINDNLECQLPNLQTHLDHQSNYIAELKAKMEGLDQCHPLVDLSLTADQYAQLQHEKAMLLAELNSLRTHAQEGESELKTAQQHLAKKVKEAALLGEKADQMQYSLNDYIRTMETYKLQILQLQTGIEKYQIQENRLQELLLEAQKNADAQSVKWEEKYFRIHDKWQACEEKIRELQKIEEKHYQVQGILSNLGSFLGGASTSHSAAALTNFVLPQKLNKPSEDTPQPTFFNSNDGQAFLEDQSDYSSGHFDLFGMQVNYNKKD